MVKARFRDVVEKLAQEIRSGAINSGTRLPTQRALAEEHDLAPATATRVYAELRKLGLVVGEVGRGTFVRAPGLQGISDLAQSQDHDPAIDLSINYPIATGQEDLLRSALTRLSRSPSVAELLEYHVWTAPGVQDGWA